MQISNRLNVIRENYVFKQFNYNLVVPFRSFIKTVYFRIFEIGSVSSFEEYSESNRSDAFVNSITIFMIKVIGYRRNYVFT